MDWSPIIIAGIGIAGTAAAPAIQSFLTARRDRLAWQRDKRADVYAEALAHAQDLESMTEHVTIEYRSARKRADLPHPDLITAKMRLHAAPATFDAWIALLQAKDSFICNLTESYPDPDEAVPTDDEDLVRLKQAIVTFCSAVKTQFGA